MRLRHKQADLRSSKIATESLPLSREKSAEQTEPKANLRLRHKQADLRSGKIATESLPLCRSALSQKLGVGSSKHGVDVVAECGEAGIVGVQQLDRDFSG